MKTSNLALLTRGWVVGNFEPSLIKTDQMEVGILKFKQGEKHAPHIHNQTDEYNILVSGIVRCNGNLYVENDIFVIEKGEETRINFLTDTVILCIKVPSIPGDKVLIDESN